MRKQKHPCICGSWDHVSHPTESTAKPRWYVGRTGNCQGLVIEEGTGKNVAVAYAKEDAPLLAAAPEMLEALKSIQQIAKGRRLPFVGDIALSAIAKAEGR